MNNGTEIIGIVQKGILEILSPARAAGALTRLTRISPQTAASPESEALDLREYEGRVLMVRGHHSGGWIYSATIVDAAGPLLSLLAMRMLTPMARAGASARRMTHTSFTLVVLPTLDMATPLPMPPTVVDLETQRDAPDMALRSYLCDLRDWAAEYVDQLDRAVAHLAA